MGSLALVVRMFSLTESSELQQNYHYLLEWAAFRTHQAMHRGRNHRNAKQLLTVGDNLQRRVASAETFRESLRKLGIEVSETEPLSHALIAYTRWQQMNALTSDPFTTLVLTIPCVYVGCVSR